MKFLLDENFPKSAEQLLAEFNHQTIDIRGTDQQGIDDFQIFEVAQHQSAVFLTTDRDFYHTVPLSYEIYYGVIVIA